MIDLTLFSDERIKLISHAIETKKLDEEFYACFTNEIMNGYEMNENEREFFVCGFINGFAYCIEWIHYLISSKRGEKNE